MGALEIIKKFKGGTLTRTLTMSGADIVMGDNSITGIDTLTFTDVNGTIAGIQNQNLLDKTATESISGAYTHTNLLTITRTGAKCLDINTSGSASGIDITNSATFFSQFPRGVKIAINDANFPGVQAFGVDIAMTGGANSTACTGLRMTGTGKRFLDLSTTLTTVHDLITVTANSASASFLKMSSSSSAYADNMLELTLSNSPSAGNFMKFINGSGDKFTVDSKGNMVVGGAYVHPRGTIGLFENNAQYSEDLSNAVWDTTNASVDPNTVDAPDGTPNIADEISFSSSSGRINQLISGKTAANNTFTYYFWGMRTEDVSNVTLRVRLTDSTRSEFSGTVGIGLIGQENLWKFYSITHTFSGSATGSPQIEIYAANANTKGSVFGSDFVDGDSVRGYVPTTEQTEPLREGGVINGHLHIGSGSGSSTIDMHEGLNQTDDYFSLTDLSGVQRAAIDNNFNWGIGTATPDAKLQVVGDTKLGDDDTNYVEIDGTGKVVFVGSAGLAYGEIYAHNNSTETTFGGTGQGNKSQITIFNTDGVSNNVTPDHTNDHITIDKDGVYEIKVSMHTDSTTGTAVKIGMEAYINNGATALENVHGHRNFQGGPGETGSMTMSGLARLTAGDTLEIWSWNETNTNPIVIEDITLSAVQIGG